MNTMTSPKDANGNTRTITATKASRARGDSAPVLVKAPQAAREVRAVNAALLGEPRVTVDNYQAWLSGAGLPIHDEQHWHLFERCEALFLAANDEGWQER